MYTNSWDPNNGQILISTDQGNTFTSSPLPFKIGGNMPGRGMGEVRLTSLWLYFCHDVETEIASRH